MAREIVVSHGSYGWWCCGTVVAGYEDGAQVWERFEFAHPGDGPEAIAVAKKMAPDGWADVPVRVEKIECP